MSQQIKAHRKVAYELSRGRLVRPNTCTHCRKPARVEAHHEDYTKPLDVVWLCKPCHCIADRLKAGRPIGRTTVKVSLSGPAEIIEAARANALAAGRSVSHYIRLLIERDIQESEQQAA